MNFSEKVYFYLAVKFSTGRILGRFRSFFENRLASVDGGYAYSRAIRILYKQQHGIDIGYGTYGGCWKNKDLWWKNVKIGNYCSFANGFFVARANHNLDFITTHPILYSPSYGAKPGNDLVSRPLVIGNDVWVGHNVIVLPGCSSIGDGAVIGAGAVVTKDVPSYSIVVGNPARILRNRFTQSQIEKIQQSHWWQYDKDDLLERVELYKDLLLNRDN